MTRKRFLKRAAVGIFSLLAAIGIAIGISGGSREQEKETTTEAKKVTGELSIHYIDVGQGDSTLITCDGMSMLIDAGENDMGSKVWSYLESQDIEKLDYVIGTHPDSDHIGGLDVVIYKFDCEKIFMPDYIKDTKTYDDVIQTVRNKNYKIENPKVGETYSLGEATFTIIAPNDDYEESNDSSIGIYLTYGENSFLFTGDAEEASEKDIVKNGINIDADVYKAGHHGSRSSSSDELLEAVTPECVIISCGEDNSYGHPHGAILNYCITNNIPIYRTDKQGTIVLKSDGKDITFNMSPADYY